MSDTASFGITDDIMKTPEERLAELERLWPIMQARLSTYDALVRDNKSVSGAIADLRTQTEACKAALQALTEGHDAASSSWANKIANVSDYVTCLENDMKTHVATLNVVRSDVVASNSMHVENVQNVQKRLVEIYSSIPKKEDMQGLKEYIDTIHAKWVDKFDDCIKALDMHEHLIADQKKKIDAQVVQNSENTSEISDQKSKIDSFKAQYEQFSGKLATLAQDAAKSMAQQFDAKLQATKNELSSSPDAINSVRDEFAKRIEGVALDSSNAALRANSSAQKLIIMEKKIENLALQVEKLNLK